MIHAFELFPAGAQTAFVAVFGLLIGSFANVLIHRLPLSRSVVWPGSKCPACDAAIAWYDNIPVISWIILGGRCRHCRVWIPARYPMVEALCSVLLVCLFLRHGPTWQWAAHGWLVVSIVALVPIDYRYGILPDRITLTGILAGLAFSLVAAQPGLVRALLGAAAGAAVPLVIRAVYMLKEKGGGGAQDGQPEEHEEERREGMGLGDVKMLAMVGAFLGAPGVLLTIMLGSLLGTFIVVPLLMSGKLTMKHPVPFGPFLGAGAIIAVFWGDRIISWYTGIALSV